MDESSGAGAAESRIRALQEFAARVVPGPQEGLTAKLDIYAAEVLQAFEKTGVDSLLLKGRGLANVLYGPGDRRGYSDIDLLVPPHQLRLAEETLTRLGYANADAARGIDDVGGVVHGQTWIRSIPESDDHPMVDLHRWFPGSAAPPAVAWEALILRQAWIDVGDRQAAVLDRPGQAMHLATHAAQHGPAFEKPVDELRLAIEMWPVKVWDAAAELALKIGALPAFAAGLRLVPRGVEIAAELRLPTTAELDWTIRQLGVRPRGTFHLQALGEAENLRHRLNILRRSLLPKRAWIVQQYSYAGGGPLRLSVAYVVHLVRTPAWAARAWRFRRRARAAARRR